MIAYALMAALALLTLIVLVQPWWRTDATRMQRRAANVASYRSRLAELDADASSGLLDSAAAESLKQELAARLLEDAQTPDAAPAVRTPRILIMLVLVLLPVFGAGWYGLAGSWRTQQIIETARADPEAAQQLAVQAMVQRLAHKLESNPDDAEGWAMLGRSSAVLQRHAEAAKAYAAANRLSGEQNPDWLIGEGEALAMQQQRNLLGRPRQLFEQALALDGENGRALWYAGLAALQAEDFKLAQRHWLALSRQELPPQLREVIEQRLAELSQLSGEPLPAPVAALSLDIEVTLAPQLRDRAAPGATLFVFAKAQNGPPMPLAVQRLPSAHLPLRVKLDDSMAMTPQLRLSQYDAWTLTARLTRGGTVQAESGDLQGQIELKRAEAGKPLRLVIDQVLP